MSKESMDKIADKATLITDAIILNPYARDSNNRERKSDDIHDNYKVLVVDRDSCWWLYREPVKTLFGSFYSACKVCCEYPIAIKDGSVANQDTRPTFFVPEDTTRLAVKRVSIDQYKKSGHEETEDPFNEIRISHYMREKLTTQTPQKGIIVPLRTFTNEFQSAPIPESLRSYFVVSQLANSGDLFDHVNNRDLSNDIGKVKSLFKQMVMSVHCLHEELNIFHRDLSIENFVLHDGKTFLIDFGQALIIESGVELIHHNGRHFGKAPYTPPELVKGLTQKYYWKQADIWALGICLYYMLFGYAPEWSVCIDEDDETRARYTITNTAHPWFQLICRHGNLRKILKENGKDYSAAHDLLQQMLWEDPNDRYSTVEILQHCWFNE